MLNRLFLLSSSTCYRCGREHTARSPAVGVDVQRLDQMAAIRTPDLPRHPHNTSSFLRFFFLGQVGTCCHSTFPVDHCEAFDIRNPENHDCWNPGAIRLFFPWRCADGDVIKLYSLVPVSLRDSGWVFTGGSGYAIDQIGM